MICELGISNGLRAAASTAPSIVNVSNTSDLPSVEISNCRQQELCCDTRSWTEPERHCRTFVTDTFEPKAEEQAVLLRDQQMHVEVRHVDLPHVIPPSELGLHCVQTLHLEVLVLQEGVDRGQVDAPSHFVGALLRHRKEGATLPECPTDPLGGGPSRWRGSAAECPGETGALWACLPRTLPSRRVG